jgi:hypothetical protein
MAKARWVQESGVEVEVGGCSAVWVRVQKSDRWACQVGYSVAIVVNYSHDANTPR